MTLQNSNYPSSLSNPDFDFDVARLAIEKGYATKEQVQDCMKEQHTLLQNGQAMQLSQLLIRKKFLTVAQFLEMIPKTPPKPDVLRCTGCKTKFKITSKTPGTKVRCKKCKTILIVPERSQATVHATADPGRDFSLSQENTQFQSDPPKPKKINPTTADTHLQSKRNTLKKVSQKSKKELSPSKSGKLPTSKAINAERQFGKYEILEEIARGGMGIVYKARQIDFNRVVALKVMKQGEFSSQEMISRFQREAQSAARLNHPNIIPIHEIGEVEGHHYFTMDYIDGTPLNELIKGKKSLSQKKIIKILKQIASGLETAHKNNIIHRDLKPANILIDERGQPQITDFGLAKVLDDQNHLTQSNAVVGTPYYMSPEQTRGERDIINACSDVYSLGVLGYHLLTKRLPFAGNSTMEIYHKINNIEAKPPCEVSPKIDKILSAILLKAIAKNPKDRYSSAQEFEEELKRYERKEKVSAYQENSQKNLFLILGIFLMLIFIGLGIGYLVRSSSKKAKTTTTKIALLTEEEKAQKLAKEKKRLALELEKAQLEKEEQQAQEKVKKLEEFNRRFQEGSNFYKNKRYINAIPCYQRCIQLFPERAIVHFQKGMCHYWQDQNQEAIESFRETIRLSPRESEAYYWLGYTQYRNKNYDDALKNFKQAIRYNPNDSRYYQARAIMYGKKKSWALAIKDYKIIIKLDPKNPDPYFELGAIHTFRKRDFELAIQYYTKCLSVRPSMIIARYNRGVCYVLKKEFEKAFKDFNDSYEQDPDKVHRLVERSLSREQNSSEFGFSSVEVNKMVEELFSSLDKSKQDPKNFIYMGIYYFYRNDFKKAINILSIAIQFNPRDEKSYIFRGLCYTKQKKYKRAIRDFEYILKNKPRDIYTRIYLAQAYLEMGQYSKALAHYEQILERDRKNVRALHKIGFIQLINEEYQEAKKKFELCLKYNSNYPYAHSLLGYTLMKLGKPEEGIPYIDQALRIDFYNSYHWGILGEVELACGKAVKAKESIEKALSFRPNDHYFSIEYYQELLASIK